ncbi:hypothetical protein KUTeg_003660 [Tegillarca granosa]|uniref:Ammonium transporter AmtB-like domain-containing protein n=1 Tax=Tegillarca granosa TaxID=220873 RepID=A0ABQ9FMQ9_TEGGR|nr:hypothetical protein KUTeg_003660 [Tegillarca granosa]
MIISKGRKLAIFLTISQGIFIILFGLFVDYDQFRQTSLSSDAKYRATQPIQQDVHLIVFIGFGFVMTFLRKYGYSAITFNLVIACVVIQWAIVFRGLIYGNVFEGKRFTLGIKELLSADFAAITVTISIGAVMGKISFLQLLVMAFIEVLLFLINEWLSDSVLKAEDAGKSIYVHTFGAYFGLAVSRVIYCKDLEKFAKLSKDNVTYESTMFSVLGTLFLWAFWPSLNAGSLIIDQQHRSVINTYLSLTASSLISFAVSAFLNKNGNLDILHIQRAALAGGVAIGATAHMPIGPWLSLLIGSASGAISTLGFKYLTPVMADTCSIHDTCGIHNVHGMPGLLAGFAGACATALATFDKWGETLFEIFPGTAPTIDSYLYRHLHQNASIWEAGLHRRSIEQAGYQMASMLLTVIVAITGGLFTGLFLRIPVWNRPKGQSLFTDEGFWLVSTPVNDDGSGNGHSH